MKNTFLVIFLFLIICSAGATGEYSDNAPSLTQRIETLEKQVEQLQKVIGTNVRNKECCKTVEKHKTYCSCSENCPCSYCECEKSDGTCNCGKKSEADPRVWSIEKDLPN